MLTADQVRQRYLDFFVKRGHVVVPSSPLVPENDPTTLFTGSGMQPMLPYLLGQPHPLGTRIVDSQKCFRSQDIEEIGDNRHDTFFEMLGNWSLGDYFKKEQIEWIWEFLTDKKEGIGLDPKRLYVSVFKGREDLGIPKDTEAVDLWKERFANVGIIAKDLDAVEEVGMQDGRIFYYDAKKNWWSRVGGPENMPVGEPGGPDSEVFFDFGAELKIHETSIFKDLLCHPNCDCGRFIEIANNVFMSYIKTDSGFKPLEKKNIDFGGGLERQAAAANDSPDIFTTTLFTQIIAFVVQKTGKEYVGDNQVAMRIIADHMRAATFLIKDGVLPANKAQGYFLRRLIRRAAVKMRQLEGSQLEEAVDSVVATHSTYFTAADIQIIKPIVKEELDKFEKTLDKGLREFDKVSAFDLYQSYGFPKEVIKELYAQKKVQFNEEEFESLKKQHQDDSRTASKGMFKGGLQDQSEATTKYHTATHLLHAALREVLGKHVQQKGSNITGERLRFDFSHPEKLSPGEIKQIEDLVNQRIEANLPVSVEEKDKSQALAEGALAFFPEKYPERTTVYSIGDFSKELCGGPHVSSTGEIGRIKIIKEEAVASGVRRIYAQLV